MKQLFALCLLFSPFVTYSQDASASRPSPLAIASTRYKDTYVKITYSQPHKRGRAVFGKLVPFDSVWRTGANEATEVTITRDIKINGFELKAGTYSVFTIPHKESWSVIFNSDLGLWGAYNYNSKMDVLKVDVPVTLLSDVVYEPFTIWLDPKNDKADLCMAWDRTKVIMSIQFSEPKP